MAKVFLSYARDDAQLAKQLAEGIGHAGHEVWWDHHLQGGSRFASEIDRQLKSAEAVVVLWTETSVNSAWVQDEAAEGPEFQAAGAGHARWSEAPLGFRQFHTVDLGSWDEDRQPKSLTSCSTQLRIPSVISRQGPRRARLLRRKSPSPGLRPAVRQHERRSRAGIFQRRHHRGHHHRPVESFGVVGHRAQQRVHSRASDDVKQVARDSA